EAAAAATSARMGADPTRPGEEAAAGLALPGHRADLSEQDEIPTGLTEPGPARDVADHHRQAAALGVAEGHPRIAEDDQASRTQPAGRAVGGGAATDDGQAG